MSWLEVMLAVFANVHAVFCVFTIIGCVGVVLSGFFGFMEEDKDAKAFAKKLAVFTSVFAVLACIPTMDDLWKVRISLIKLQLASPENVQKGADVIERLGKKLECKYLGCEEEKK